MKEPELAPIVIFVYNRPWHVQQTIEALQKNDLADKSELFIYSDAPKNEQAMENVAKVRKYIRTIKGFKKITIIERDKNRGLANTIIDGITRTVNDYGRVIVMEDDLVTSPYFLRYMNEGLELYHDNYDIMSISGFNLPPAYMKFPKNFTGDVYLNYRNCSSGWATWADRWSLVDWDIEDFHQFMGDPEKQKLFNRGGDDLTDMLKSWREGKIDAWDIQFSYAHFKHGMYSIYPRYSYVNHIGNDGSGTHGGEPGIDENDLSLAKCSCNLVKNIQFNEDVMLEFAKFYKNKHLPVLIINKISKVLFKRRVIM